MLLQRALTAGLALLIAGSFAEFSPAFVSMPRSEESAQQTAISPAALDALARMEKTLSAKQFSHLGGRKIAPNGPGIWGISAK